MRYEVKRVPAVPTPVFCAYLTELGMEGTVHDGRLIRQIIVVEFSVLSLGAISDWCKMAW